MKTPMQELFEQIKEYQITNRHIPIAVQDGFLEKEKKAIADAYNSGAQEEFSSPESGEQYYKETFKPWSKNTNS